MSFHQQLITLARHPSNTVVERRSFYQRFFFLPPFPLDRARPVICFVFNLAFCRWVLLTTASEFIVIRGVYKTSEIARQCVYRLGSAIDCTGSCSCLIWRLLLDGPLVDPRVTSFFLSSSTSDALRWAPAVLPANAVIMIMKMGIMSYASSSLFSSPCPGMAEAQTHW